MKELSNYELCLLVHLCYIQNKKRFPGVSHPKGQMYFKAWTKLQNSINNYIHETVIIVSEPSKGGSLILAKPLIIQVKEKKLLENFLDDYCNYLAQDSLDSLSDGMNFTKLAKEFRASIDKNKKLTEYYLDSTLYIPIILWGIRKEFIKVKEMRFSLFPDEESQNRVSKLELRRRKLGSNEFEFCMTADLSKFMNITFKKHRHENYNRGVSEKDYVLEPQDWKMYFCILFACELSNNSSQIDGLCIISRELFTYRKVYTVKSEAKARSQFCRKVRNNLDKSSNKAKILLLGKDENTYYVNIKLLQEFQNKIKMTPFLQKGVNDNKNFYDVLKSDYEKITNGK